MIAKIRVLGPEDLAVLRNVAADVFDHDIDEELASEFLMDPRHHIVVALDDGLVVGMASAIHYIHPDKNPELWINEVGVASTHRKMGIGKRLIDALLKTGESAGCHEAWVLAKRSNSAAMKLYSSAGGSHAEDQVMFTMKLNPNHAFHSTKTSSAE